MQDNHGYLFNLFAKWHSSEAGELPPVLLAAYLALLLLHTVGMPGPHTPAVFIRAQKQTLGVVVVTSLLLLGELLATGNTHAQY